MKLSNLFEIKYGVNLELINCEIDNENGIPFVSRTSNNNGVIAKVKRIEGIIPNHAGSLNCAGGGSVLSTFFQDKEYYSGRDLYVLIPKNKEMSILEKLYYCMLISKNNYRYNYGRQANRTLKDIEVPDFIPDWVQKYNLEDLKSRLKTKKENFHTLNDIIKLDKTKWKEFSLDRLFNISPGKYYSIEEYDKGKTPYISVANTNNGIQKRINLVPDFKGNCIITGKVGCTAFYQFEDFCATSDVNIFYPKYFKMTPALGLFFVTVINFSENYKWNYGRQCRIGDSKKIIIKLPIQNKNNIPVIDTKKVYSAEGFIPDWEFMENYIKSLSYSDKI